ncbi:MAG: MFS transporter, partial [Candidatus Rokuibacteriota bacterium]
FARRHLRRNVLALGVDFGLFLVGWSFASQSTLLPAFAAHLGAPYVVIGAIPAVMTTGWYLPSLFVAGHTQTLAEKLPFVLRFTLWERVPFLILALVAFVLAAAAPMLALVAVLLLLLVITLAGGLLMPAWMDIVGRTIPTEIRGRFFAFATVLGSAGGLLGGIVTAWVLASVPAPASYGYCFLGAAFFMTLSYVALLLVREPPGRAQPPVDLKTHLLRVPALLRQDPNLTWFLAARGAMVVGTMAAGFYTVHALEHLGAPAWRVGVFTSVLLAGQTVGNVALGWLADRAGHRLVLIVGAAASVGGNVLALGAPSLDVFVAVFALVGMQFAAVNVSAMNVMLEFAPVVEERPTYIGLGNTAVAPLTFAAPLAGGLVAGGLGFPALFILAGLFGAAGLGLLLACVHDPRRVPPVVPPSAAVAS